MGGERGAWARWRARAGRLAGALLVVLAAAWLLSPPEPAPPRVAPFGTAAPESPDPEPGPSDGDPGPTTTAEAEPSRGGRPPPRPVDSQPEPATSSLDAFGVYIGGEDLATVESYEDAVGLADGQALRYALRYASGREGDWETWRRTVRDLLVLFDAPGQPRTLVLSLPLVVGQPLAAGHPDLRAAGIDTDSRSLEAGAAGAYDGQWRWLGQELARRFGRELPASVVLRPGWEANGGWYDWGYGTGPSSYDVGRAGAFARYWRRLHDVVTAELRAAGTDVHWLLNAAASGYTSGGFEAAWPGDAYVDIVSLDIYQNYAFRSTTDFTAADTALRWLEAVGTARGKLVALDETSVSSRVRNGRQQGGRDNGLWFRSLRAWADRVAAEGQLHHLLAFEADPAPTDLFGPVFPRYPEIDSFPEARRDLIASFGGPRSVGEGIRVASGPGSRLGPGQTGGVDGLAG